MKKKNEFITDDCVIENEAYKSFKDLIKCIICNQILKDPIMCKECQKVFCKSCLDNWKNNSKKCPNKCKKPKYVKNIDKHAMLSLISFRCKNCKEEIKYDNVQSHLSLGCEKNLVEDRLVDSIYIKKKLRKLSKKEITEIADKGIVTNHLSSKINIIKHIYLFFICIVITLGIGKVGKSSLINT